MNLSVIPLCTFVYTELSLDEILGQGVIAFVAGYETTATLMTFLSYVLATHPDIQEKLLKEIDEHLTEVCQICSRNF